MARGMQFNHERAALILCDAAFVGDTKTSQKWGVTLRTIANYRERLGNDPIFSNLFQLKRRALEENWKEELARAITTGVKKMARMIDAAPEGYDFNATALEAVTGAVKVLSEIQITTEVLNAGNVEQGQSGAKESRAMA